MQSIKRIESMRQREQSSACEQQASKPSAWTSCLAYQVKPRNVGNDLADIVKFQAPHLSIYALTIEPNTALERRINQGTVRVASDELSASMLFTARDYLQDKGYRHYEVSSYAKPGFRAKHNSAYWRMQPTGE